MRIGVYVGTFDPVHKGHINVINHLINNDYVDKVIVIPTGNYWDKKNITDIKHRINMLKLYENKLVTINDNLNSIPYTYQILDELKKEYPLTELYLIIGADNLEKFHLWEKVDIILKNKILVLPRNNIEVDKYMKDNFILVKDFQPLDISSTDIRNNFNKEYLDDEVINYITKNNLYKRNINNIKLFVNDNDKSKKISKIVEEKIKKFNFNLVDKNYDLAIAIGGDGSFLRMIKSNNFNSDIYYVGINAGTLGFAQEVSIDNIDEFLNLLNTNQYKIEEIGIQETSIKTPNTISRFFSLNEIAIRDKELNTTKIKVEIDDIELEKYFGDGLLVATSFGSTAYNLSFGGSIIYDTLHTLQITPIAPLNNKSYRCLLNSYVVPENKVIKLYPDTDKNNLIVTVDGENNIYDNVELIETVVDKKRIKCLRNKNYDFSKKVNEKFLR